MTLADRPRRSEESRQRRSNASLLIQPTTNTNSYVCCGHAWQPSATPPPSYTRTSRARLARPAPAPRGYMHDLQLPQKHTTLLLPQLQPGMGYYSRSDCEPGSVQADRPRLVSSLHICKQVDKPAAARARARKRPRDLFVRQQSNADPAANV